MTKGEMPIRPVTCSICGASFQSTHSMAKYCSPGCQRLGARKSWNKYDQANKSARKTYRDGYYEANRDAIIDRTSAYQQTEAGKRATKINDARQRAKFPEKYAGRQAVLMAVRKGDLVPQPCWCGETKVQGHHPDYSKPLDVVWLCRPHHDAEHQAMKVAA